MKRKIVIGSALCIVMLLASTGMLRSQGLPPGAEVGPPPGTPMPPGPAQRAEFSFRGGEAWLGVAVQDVTAEKARELKLPGEFGAVVERVEAGSPASKAGLEKGDVIVEFAGERVRSVAQLQRLVRETPVGRTVVLQVARAGQTRTLNVQVETGDVRFFRRGGFAMPPMEMPNFDYRVFTGGPTLGISGDDLTSQLAEYFGVKQGKGVLVREVEPGSAAEKAGLKAGDVITRVDDASVSGMGSLRRALPHHFEGKRKVNLSIVRNRREQTLAVELEASGEPMRFLERETTRLREQQAGQLASQIAERKADLQRAVEQASRAWTQQYQRYLQGMRQSMELLQRELQKQKLQELREKLPRADVV